MMNRREKGFKTPKVTFKVTQGLGSLILMPFDRTHVISYQPSIVTRPISLSCTVSEILALISKHLRGHVTLNEPPILQIFNTCIAGRPLLLTLNLQTKLKCLASAPKIRSGPQDVKIGHVTLTTPTLGIIRHHKANTTRGKLLYEIGSLYL